MSPSDRPPTTLIVPDGVQTRLDRFLAQHLPDGSRLRARELIVARAVRVNGHGVPKAYTVQPGDVIEIADAAPPTGVNTLLVAQPELDVALLYEDAAVVAVDKPAGMPSTAVRSTDRGTVANFLAGRYPDAPPFERPLEAGLAHRLDTGTSGVLLAARTVAALSMLRSQFRAHEVDKHYLALVDGDVATAGTVSYPIAHAPRHRRRMIACQTAAEARDRKGRAAVTFYRPIERFGTVTLLEIRMQTGVRHQIRVHLASIGHPLIGDAVYRRGGDDDALQARLFLHAARVTFRHPTSGELVTVTAPQPRELGTLVAKLRGAAARKKPPSFKRDRERD